MEQITKPIISFNSKKISFLMMPHLTHVPVKKKSKLALYFVDVFFLFDKYLLMSPKCI
jgi:hypothetical protein